MDPFEKFIGVLCLILLAFCLWPLAYLPAFVSTETQCLAAGYRDSSVDFFFNRYCITRQDQTDVVIPLAEALRKEVK